MLSFFGTLKSPFLYDDAHSIIDNPYIQNLWDFQAQVGIENIFNRSVVLLTYAVNRDVGQLNVFGFHLVNILLHTCVGIALYFMTRHLLFLESRSDRYVVLLEPAQKAGRIQSNELGSRETNPCMHGI